MQTRLFTPAYVQTAKLSRQAKHTHTTYSHLHELNCVCPRCFFFLLIPNFSCLCHLNMSGARGEAVATEYRATTGEKKCLQFKQNTYETTTQWLTGGKNKMKNRWENLKGRGSKMCYSVEVWRFVIECH